MSANLTILILQEELSWLLFMDNSNWTGCSTIQGVIRRVISKSAECAVRGRFEIIYEHNNLLLSELCYTRSNY